MQANDKDVATTSRPIMSFSYSGIAATLIRTWFCVPEHHQL
jgi:hypothetical protein